MCLPIQLSIWSLGSGHDEKISPQSLSTANHSQRFHFSKKRHRSRCSKLAETVVDRYLNNCLEYKSLLSPMRTWSPIEKTMYQSGEASLAKILREHGDVHCKTGSAIGSERQTLISASKLFSPPECEHSKLGWAFQSEKNPIVVVDRQMIWWRFA